MTVQVARIHLVEDAAHQVTASEPDPDRVVATAPGRPGGPGPSYTPIFDDLAEALGLTPQSAYLLTRDVPGMNEYLGTVTTTGDQTIGGSKTFTSDIDMAGGRIHTVSEPSSDSDVATKGYVDAVDTNLGLSISAIGPIVSAKVDKSGVASVLYGTDGSGAQATYTVRSAATASAVAQRGAGGVLKVGTPSAADDAATKSYADAVGASAANYADAKVAANVRVFIQQADPETTNPTATGPAIWYVTDNAGKIVNRRVRY